MDRGIDFLKSQVSNAVMQHRTMLQSIEDHESQAEDTFKTFREAGRALNIQQLATIGEVGERHHDEYVKEANKLAQQMFIEHVRGAEGAAQVSDQPTQPL